MKNLFLILFLLFSPQLFSQSYQMFSGKYTVENAPFSQVEFIEKNNKLFAFTEEYGTTELFTTENKMIFEEKTNGAKIEFTQSENNIINGFILNVQGQNFTGYRVFPSLHDFSGKYEMESSQPVPTLIFTVENKELFIEAGSFGKGKLEPTSILNKFTESNYNSQIVFLRDSTGQVNSVKLSVQGSDFEGIKQINEYIGNYDFVDTPLENVIIKEENGKLYGVSGNDTAELIPLETTDKFKVDGYEGTAFFIRDENNKIFQLEVNIQGTQMIGNKK